MAYGLVRTNATCPETQTPSLAAGDHLRSYPDLQSIMPLMMVCAEIWKFSPHYECQWWKLRPASPDTGSLRKFPVSGVGRIFARGRPATAPRLYYLATGLSSAYHCETRIPPSQYAVLMEYRFFYCVWYLWDKGRARLIMRYVWIYLPFLAKSVYFRGAMDFD